MASRLTPPEDTGQGAAIEVPHGPNISRRHFIAGLGAASGAIVVGVAIRGASPAGAVSDTSVASRT